ncbi:MAG: TetR/AcrR family transcriptional regulator [Lachnospiraceae bacterium]|nr:TetR/AcrR family transcriptional regulator [Lachnospiraceae bacterium]
MGDKSIQKKRYIVEKAAEVFGKKGYKNVTMKDIVEACEISRGGLYLYFNSTKEIFEAVLESRRLISKTEDSSDMQPGDRLLAFLEEKKQEIVSSSDYLRVAIYEYMFAHGEQDSMVAGDFDADLQRLEEIIEDGVASDWMVCEAPRIAAYNMLYALEGLKVSAQTGIISEERVDEQIEYMMGTIGLALE